MDDPVRGHVPGGGASRTGGRSRASGPLVAVGRPDSPRTAPSRRSAVSCLAGLCLLLAGGVGCSGPDGPAGDGRPGPTLEKVGEVTLQESPSLYLGAPSSLWVDDDGSFFVADYFAGRIVRFDREGRPTETYGAGRGSGPGELEGVGTTFVVGTLVVAEDAGDDLLEQFDRRTGEHVGSRDFTGDVGRAVPEDSVVWLGNRSRARNSSVLLWRRDTGALDYAVPLPREYRRSAPLYGTYSRFSVAPAGDTVLVGYMGLDRLSVHDRDLNRLGWVGVPAERRREEPEDLVRRVNETGGAQERFRVTSFLFGVHRMPDGTVAVVHYDQDLGSVTSRRIEAEVWVSLLSAHLDRACVDRRVPTADAAQPVLQMRGDTLFLLQQEVREDRGRARTFVEAYRISSVGCEWRPTTRTGPAWSRDEKR